MSRKIILDKENLKKVKKWNKTGKPSGYVDPPHWGFLPKFPTAMQKIKERPEIKRILDVGCFTGYFLRHLAAVGYHCVGVDIQKDLMDDLDRQYKPNPAFRYLNMEALTTVYGKEFDCVTMFDSLEHALDDVVAIRQAEGVLKDGGWMIINLPRNEEYPDDSGEHVRNYDDKDIKRLFGKKKNFSFELCADEVGRPTSFITYQV